jgi:hypothetical protein
MSGGRGGGKREKVCERTAHITHTHTLYTPGAAVSSAALDGSVASDADGLLGDVGGAAPTAVPACVPTLC